MPLITDQPLTLIAAVFAGAALVIAAAGTVLALVADELADRTGLGEAIMGALFVGASTSLPGIVTSVATAAGGHPELAVGNALGGIAAQTAFLAIADIAYRKANLEHAAASAGNLIQGTLLVSLLAIPMLAAAAPAWHAFGVSPASGLIVIAYLLGLRLLGAAGRRPMWKPRLTGDTQHDGGAGRVRFGGSATALWLRFAGLAAVLAVSGWVVAQTGVAIAQRTGLSETAVGALFTAVATSLPELAIAIAAVRAGALILAVGDIIGGNCFDVLFLAAADVAWRDGSIYAYVTDGNAVLVAATLLMTGVLLIGMLHRERLGFARIGFESTLVLVIYAGTVALVAR